MEVYAIAQCAKMVNLLHRNNSSIAICSDSLSAIQAVSAAKVTTGTVADAMQALKRLQYTTVYASFGFLDTVESRAMKGQIYWPKKLPVHHLLVLNPL